jgi:hypothetical protein
LFGIEEKHNIAMERKRERPQSDFTSLRMRVLSAIEAMPMLLERREGEKTEKERLEITSTGTFLQP